jgi:hypothetical protein
MISQRTGRTLFVFAAFALLVGGLSATLAFQGKNERDRVETFRDNASDVTLSNDVQWLKVMVDPKSREVFDYQAQIVPGNRVAVPAP